MTPNRPATTMSYECRWVRGRLPLMAGGDLLGPERRHVERHVVGCVACRGLLESHRRSLGALHAAAAAESPALAAAPSLWPDLARQLREARRPRSPRFGSLPIPWPIAAAMAATLIAGLSLALFVGPLDPETLTVAGSPKKRPAASTAASTGAADAADGEREAVAVVPSPRRDEPRPRPRSHAGDAAEPQPTH